MSRPEDKTLNTVRILSDKRASKNQGSIVTSGGIYVGNNIECEKELVAEDLVVKGLTKLAGDVSIGGRLYCPGIYNMSDENICFKRGIMIEKFDIINPQTNTIMAKNCGDGIEVYAPVYTQWNSFRAVRVPYHPQKMLLVTCSIIFVEGCGGHLHLAYDMSIVPTDTQVKIYFILNGKASRVTYHMVLKRGDAKCTFSSEGKPTKKAKLYFLADVIYSL